MTQEQQQMSTTRFVGIGPLISRLVGLAASSVAFVPTASAATETVATSTPSNHLGWVSGVGIPRWLIALVVLLGTLVAVGYVGAKGYEIVESSKL
jgi:hypothetical protein